MADIAPAENSFLTRGRLGHQLALILSRTADADLITLSWSARELVEWIKYDIDEQGLRDLSLYVERLLSGDKKRLCTLLRSDEVRHALSEYNIVQERVSHHANGNNYRYSRRRVAVPPVPRAVVNPLPVIPVPPPVPVPGIKRARDVIVLDDGDDTEVQEPPSKRARIDPPVSVLNLAEGEECSLCLVAATTVSARPCNHCVLCEACAGFLQLSVHGAKCIVCQQDIEKLVVVTERVLFTRTRVASAKGSHEMARDAEKMGV